MDRLLRISDHPGPTEYLLDGSDLVIGRAEDVAICVPHTSLSRRHAQLEPVDGGYQISDLGSKNGTWVNEKPIEGPARLEHGDRLTVGQVTLRLELMIDITEGATTVDPRATWSTAQLAGLDDLNAADRAADETTRLKVMLRVAEELARPRSLKGTLERVLDLTAVVLDADRLSILRLTDEGLIPVVAHEGGHPIEANGDRVWSNKVAELVLRRGLAMRFSDLDTDTRVASDSVAAQGIRCAMCAPLMHEGSVFGVLYADNLVTTRAFDDIDLQLFVAIANQSALALHHALLREQIEQRMLVEHTLLRFFPPQVARRLIDQGAQDLQPVVVDATVLFADIVSFTSLSSSLRPDRVLELLNEFFPPMVNAIQAEEGTLEKYIGDAVMAVWGAPYPQPDAVDRAVRAAIGMQQAIDRVNERLAELELPPIAIYVGLHTGPVAFGNVGADQYIQVATVGDTTNVASRVCNAAAAGEIWISEHTADLLEIDIGLTALPDVTVKGKDKPLKVFRVER